MTEEKKKTIMGKVLQYGSRMAQGKYVSAQRLYSEIDRSIKTDKEEFLENMEKSRC